MYIHYEFVNDLHVKTQHKRNILVCFIATRSGNSETLTFMIEFIMDVHIFCKRLELKGIPLFKYKECKDMSQYIPEL